MTEYCVCIFNFMNGTDEREFHSIFNNFLAYRLCIDTPFSNCKLTWRYSNPRSLKQHLSCFKERGHHKKYSLNNNHKW